jgi:hypothetical protein
MKSKSPPRPLQGRDDRQAHPVSDSDRLFRGLPMESGEAQPDPQRRLH